MLNACYIKTKSFQMTQGGHQVIIILPIKSEMAAAKKYPANNFTFSERCENVLVWLWKRFDITF